MTRKSLAAAAVLLTALGAYQWSPTGVSYPLPPGELHAVTVADGRAEVDLPFATADEQYLLVVGNLSRDVAPRRITLATRPVDRVERVALLPVPELRSGVVNAGELSSGARPEESTARDAHRTGGLTPPARPGTRHDTRRTFWLNVAGGATDNPAAFRPIAARLAAEGDGVRVYADRDDVVDDATTAAVVASFDAVVRPRYAEWIGIAPDVDGDGKLAVVLTGWLGRLQGGTVSVGGLVQPRDFDRHLAAPLSNRADVLFLNAETTRPGAHLQNLLAHEYAHAVLSGARNAAASGDVVYEEAWLDEALAHRAEELFGAGWSNLDYRLAAFLAAPQQAPLVVADYQQAGLWRSPAPRGHTFLFLRWCAERYGAQLLPALVAADHCGRENIEAATGEPFDELYRRFAADLLLREGRPDDGEPDRDRPATSSPLSLTGPVGNWPLAGPRRECWELPAGVDARGVAVSGTSSAYYLLSAAGQGPRRLTIDIEAGGQLQVSLVRLPDDLPRLSVRVLRDNGGQQRIEIAELGGRTATVEQIAWGAMAFAPDAAAAQVCLRGAAVASLLGEARLPGGRQLVSHHVDFAALTPGEAYVSVVAVDEQGRRVTAWTRFDPSTAAPPLAAVARPQRSG